MSFSQIPAEVVDHILDQLHGDKESLSACSLVTKAWVHTCHYHLFHLVRFGPDVARGGFRELFDYLQDRPFGAYVRELQLLSVPLQPTLVTSGLLFDLFGTYRSDIPSSLDPSILPDILDRLPNLRSLELDGVYIPPHFALPLTRRFSLQTLVLRNITSRTNVVDSVFSVLDHFENVKTLHILGSPGRETFFHETDHQCSLDDLKVESLVFKDSYSTGLFKAITQLPFVAQLRSLTVFLSGMIVGQLGDILNRVRPQIQHLEIAWPNETDIFFLLSRDRESILTGLNISTCPNLRSFTLPILVNPIIHKHKPCFTLNDDEAETRPISAFSLDLLALASHASEVTIKLLVLHDSWDYLKDPKYLDWERLESILQTFGCLERLSVNLIPLVSPDKYNPDDFVLAAEFVRRVLEQFKAIVRVTPDPDTLRSLLL